MLCGINMEKTMVFSSSHRARVLVLPMLVFLLGPILSGCTGTKKEMPPCPETGLILAASQISVFAENAAPETESKLLDGYLADYRGSCRNRDGALEFDLELDIIGQRGPAGEKLKRAEFPYFVALLDPAENILQRQGFSSTVSFDNAGGGMKTEKHRLRFMPEDGTSLRLHKVAIGFELTPEQLAYNRRAEEPAAMQQKKPAAR